MKRLRLRALSVGLAIMAVLGVGGWAYLHPGRGPRESVDPHANAYLETVEGLPILHLKGLPYEMGYQHGALARDGVAASIRSFEQLLEQNQRDTGIPVFVFNLMLDVVYRRCNPHIPEHLKRELEGLADGSGQSLRVLRRIHVVSELTARNCSAFAVFGKATVGGTLYHGHNFDWEINAHIQDNAALFLYEPNGGIPFAAFGYLGMVGYASGMNMEGITVGIIGAVSEDMGSGATPFMLLLREVLEKAQDLDQACAIIADAPRSVGYNYVIGFAGAPAAKALETTAHHCAVFTDNDPKESVEYAIPITGAVFRADEAMDPTVRSFQRCSRGYPNLPYGCNSYEHRYKGMATRIQQSYGKIDEAVALEILKAVAMRNTNLHSVLCDATNRAMWVSRAHGTEDAWKQPYIHVDLRQMFLPPSRRR